jgi:hypothetical protein
MADWQPSIDRRPCSSRDQVPCYFPSVVGGTIVPARYHDIDSALDALAAELTKLVGQGDTVTVAGKAHLRLDDAITALRRHYGGSLTSGTWPLK